MRNINKNDEKNGQGNIKISSCSSKGVVVF